MSALRNERIVHFDPRFLRELIVESLHSGNHLGAVGVLDRIGGRRGGEAPTMVGTESIQCAGDEVEQHGAPGEAL